MNLVISGPSGAGKGLVISKLQDEMNFNKSISYTTRNIRDDEINGKSYYFVSKEKFINLKNNDFFFEIIEYDGNFYGIPKKNISLVNSNENIVFDLVPTSGINLKKYFDNTCLVYVIPQCEDILKIRRGNRGDDRVICDIIQLEYAKKYYDYLIINSDINETMEQLNNIIKVFKQNSISNKEEFLSNFFSKSAKVKRLVK